ncbi:MAG TPA: hypothetical protein VJ695_01565 [Nitrososphaera sp.]|nr:hypothetical protein [Nitrososphaera sp.]
MSSDNTTANKNNGDDIEIGNYALLQEAYELAESRKWTRDFALYIMFCRAMAEGDKMRAERCMNLLERDVMNSLSKDDYSTGPSFER